jgi:hypothetical protein
MGAVPNQVESSTRSSETFSQIKQWINICLSEHPECRRSTDHRVLPTRLVRAERTGTSFEVKANICRGDTLPKETPYLTLSHCWGKTKFLTTTRANLSSFELSIPVDGLSRTFRDALFATVNLGFQYIWIDSLCIVQDDTDDWERESRLMQEVYKNASCNISASGSPDGMTGFISAQREIDPAPVIIDSGNQSLDAEDSTPREACGETYHLAYAHPWRGLKRGPIFLRAWTLQEQLLVSILVPKLIC